MNEKCFEIGTIQAFLDGETSPELSFRITDHVAECDKCALAIGRGRRRELGRFFRARPRI